MLLGAMLQIRTWLGILDPHAPAVQDLPANARKVKGEVRSPPPMLMLLVTFYISCRWDPTEGQQTTAGTQ